MATCSKEHGRALLKKVSATYPGHAMPTMATLWATLWLHPLQVSATYPGRASVSPILDLFCTLLHLGVDGWTKLLADRQALMPPFRVQLAALAERHGERLLHTPNNTISMAITLSPEAGGLYLPWLYLPWLYSLWLYSPWLTMALLTMALLTMALLTMALLRARRPPSPRNGRVQPQP